MIGNCYEWTTEFFSSPYNPCVGRGGFYGSTNYCGASRFYNPNQANYNSGTSFRIQLYIK